MNEMNSIEKNLQSWTPRDPSPKVRERLFGRKPEPSPRALWIGVRNWAAPAAAFSLTLMVLLGGHGWHPARFSDANRIAAVAMLGGSPSVSSNWEAQIWSEPVLAFSSRDLNLEWNVWSKTSFESTNYNLSPSSNASGLFSTTNRVD